MTLEAEWEAIKQELRAELATTVAAGFPDLAAPRAAEAELLFALGPPADESELRTREFVCNIISTGLRQSRGAAEDNRELDQILPAYLARFRGQPPSAARN